MNVAFWCLAAGMSLLGCLLLVLPATRSRNASRAMPESPEAATVLVLREALDTLDAEFSAGQIDAIEREQGRHDIEHRALSEAAGGAAPGRVRASRRHAAWLGLAVTAFAFVVYGFVGNIGGLETAPVQASRPPDSEATQARESEAMLDGMVQQMQAQRAGTVDAAGWALVARSYASLHRFDKASSAFARAIAIAPDDAALLVDHADVLAMLQGHRMQGEPSRLADRALQIDPQNPKALALAGSAAFERNDLPAAIDFWTRAREHAPMGAFATGMDAQLATARAAMDAARSSAALPK